MSKEELEFKRGYMVLKDERELKELFCGKMEWWKEKNGRRSYEELCGALMYWGSSLYLGGALWNAIYGQICFLAKRNECLEEKVVEDLFQTEKARDLMAVLQL